jgi:hypothetical protein
MTASGRRWPAFDAILELGQSGERSTLLPRYPATRMRIDAWLVAVSAPRAAPQTPRRSAPALVRWRGGIVAGTRSAREVCIPRKVLARTDACALVPPSPGGAGAGSHRRRHRRGWPRANILRERRWEQTVGSEDKAVESAAPATHRPRSAHDTVRDAERRGVRTLLDVLSLRAAAGGPLQSFIVAMRRVLSLCQLRSSGTSFRANASSRAKVDL